MARFFFPAPDGDASSLPSAASSSASEAAARLSLALAAADLGDWSWDPATDIVTLSARAAEIFGLVPGVPVTWTAMRSLLSEADCERAKLAVEQAVAQRTDYDIQYLVHLPQGGDRWVAAKGRGLYDGQGNVVGMLGVVQDVTAQRLRDASRQFLLRLIDTIRLMRDAKAVQWHVVSATGMFFGVSRCTYGEIDPAEEYVLVERDFTNGAASAAGQHRLSAFGDAIVSELKLGKTLVIHDALSDPRIDAEAQRALAALEARSTLCVPLVKDHRLVALFALHHRLPRAWSSHEVWLVEQLAERTWFAVEQARTEAEREASEARFHVLADAAPVLIWMANTDKLFTWVNKSWLAYTGRKLEEELGWGWASGVHADDRERCATVYAAAFEARRPFTMEYRLRHRDGDYRWLLDNGVPLFSGAQFDGYIGSCVDIHARKLAEQEREQLLAAERAARLEAERLNRSKDEFLSIVSHELRTPLNAIVGWTQLMSMDVLPPEEIAQGIEVIQRNARLQTQIIEDLLDMSRIVSGKMRLDIQTIDLEGVIRGAIDSVRPAADAKEIRIEIDIDPHATNIRGDNHRLQQVVWNLLSNAVKFTPRSGRVKVELEGASENVEVRISDTGQGIGPDFLPFVFDRFRQADTSTTRRHGGLGIGLAIVKNLVELHGGFVRVHSPGEHRGSTFVVSLPRGVPHYSTPPAGAGEHDPSLPTIDLSGLCVLVVDDEPDARQVVARLLERHGAEALLATSADEALDLLRKRRPDVLLSDIGMPQRDGYELIRDVRLLPPAAGRSTPAAALTAFARSEDRQRAMLAGFQAHVAKPVDAAELLAVVAMLAGRTVGSR